MNNLNSVLIEGNLVKDPELKTTSQGSKLCKLTIATNRNGISNNQPVNEVSYFDITVWSRQAESCNHYLRKGSGIRAVGRLKQDRWTDSEGKKCYRIHIVADHVEFMRIPKESNAESINPAS